MKTEIPVCKCLLPTGIGDFCDRCGLLASREPTPSHSEETETTPLALPVRSVSDDMIQSAGDDLQSRFIATVHGNGAEETDAIRSYIVTAVNSYSTLKADNERLEQEVKAYRNEEKYGVERYKELQSDNAAKQKRIQELESQRAMFKAWMTKQEYDTDQEISLAVAFEMKFDEIFQIPESTINPPIDTKP